MSTSTWRAIGSSAIALAVAAIFVPTAVAGVRPDDRDGPLGVGGTSSAQVAPVRPDDRADRTGVGVPASATSTVIAGSLTANPAVRPDDRDTARGPGVFFTAPPQVAAADVFQWDDAGLGAAATIGALLLAAATAFTIRRRFRPIAH